LGGGGKEGDKKKDIHQRKESGAEGGGGKKRGGGGTFRLSFKKRTGTSGPELALDCPQKRGGRKGRRREVLPIFYLEGRKWRRDKGLWR